MKDTQEKVHAAIDQLFAQQKTIQSDLVQEVPIRRITVGVYTNRDGRPHIHAAATLSYKLTTIVG